MIRRLQSGCVFFFVVFLCSTLSSADSYVVTLAEDVGGTPRNGRLILFIINKQGWQWDRTDPMEGPFYENPQPIASMAIRDFKPGDRIAFSDDAVSVPVPLDQLEGVLRVQAVLDVDHRVRSHAEGQGNVYSSPQKLTVSRSADDKVNIILDQVVEVTEAPQFPNVRYVELPSPLLSAHAGFPVKHRAAVVLPVGYEASENELHKWGAVYVIPGFGGRLEGVRRLARQQSRAQNSLPVVYVLLDPDAPLSHHGFADSPANGPRATALVQELIPHLEANFRLADKPDGRLLTGHSSGGWATLWLQLNHPDVFGGTWSTAPDPIDFSAFGMVDLYQEDNIFVDKTGKARPVYRTDSDEVAMTIKQETDMEWAMDPTGGSGQQWDTWESMFSPLDPTTQRPLPLFDQSTGKIDHEVVENWSNYDITRLVEKQWPALGPVVLNRVHLICGGADSFYLERAVERFSEMVQSKAPESDGTGYIVMLQGADHGQAAGLSARRIRTEMHQHLKQAKLLPNHSSTSNP
jgi:hypothetical protein